MTCEADGRLVVAVDARTLTQTGKGIPRFLFETLRELIAIPTIRLVLFSNRPLHPDNALPVETVIDHTWRKVPGSIWMLARLNQLAKRAGAEVLWGPAHVLPLRTKGLRSILTVHDLVYRIMPESMSLWNKLISRFLVDASIRRADRIAADSQTTSDDVVSEVGIDGARIEVVYLGTRVAPSDLDGSQTRSGRDPDPYLFALGSIEPRKNIDGLLDCLEEMKSLGSPISLRLTGAHSWNSTETLRRVQNSASCRVLGFLSDREITKELMGARAFVMPSHYEGFGLPLIEAVDLAPIIAADIPVFRELGRFIEGIHFVDFSDPRKAAHSIRGLLSQDRSPARFLPLADQTFRWPHVAERYAAIFTGNR